MVVLMRPVLAIVVLFVCATGVAALGVRRETPHVGHDTSSRQRWPAWPHRHGVVQAAAQASVEVVEIAAERFSFTPSEIRTRMGSTLEFRLSSDDTAHGFRILGTDVNVEIPKRGRGSRSVTFTPATPGRYTFECSRLCGAGHSFMRGVIVVSEATGR
jgi:heme/copper-type cytochrome/quinol oxidase subunit 2